MLGIAMRESAKGSMKQLKEALVTVESGIENDTRGKQGKRQVTVLAREAWDEACARLGRELPWTYRRANLFIEGVPLKDTVGFYFSIGEIVLRINCETTPCERMDEAFQGLRESLTPSWRGGVSCSVVKGGKIHVGDEITIVSSE